MQKPQTSRHHYDWILSSDFFYWCCRLHPSMFFPTEAQRVQYCHLRSNWEWLHFLIYNCCLCCSFICRPSGRWSWHRGYFIYLLQGKVIRGILWLFSDDIMDLDGCIWSASLNCVSRCLDYASKVLQWHNSELQYSSVVQRYFRLTWWSTKKISWWIYVLLLVSVLEKWKRH